MEETIYSLSFFLRIWFHIIKSTCAIKYFIYCLLRVSRSTFSRIPRLLYYIQSEAFISEAIFKKSCKIAFNIIPYIPPKTEFNRLFIGFPNNHFRVWTIIFNLRKLTTVIPRHHLFNRATFNSTFLCTTFLSL